MPGVRGGPGSGAGASDLAVVGDTLFFAGCDAARGWELWRSDGREAGTFRVADIWRGRGHSRPDEMVAANGVLYFSADDGLHGAELWRSDGTRHGTYLVADIRVGPRGSLPFKMIWAPARQRLYFAADDGVHGEELWTSDGTREGTYLVADSDPGLSGSHPRDIREAGTEIYFRARVGFPAVRRDQLYALVEDDVVSIAGPSFVDNAGLGEQVAAFRGATIFAGETVEEGAGLWRVDDPREPPTRLDLGEGWPRYALDLTAVGDWLYFIAPPPGRGFNRELFRTDGTAAGTVQLSNVSPEERNAHGLKEIDGRVYFYSKAQDAFSRGVYVSDGTAEGTQLISDVHLGTCRKLPPGEFVPVGQRIFFVGHDGARGEPWVTDGTDEGTYQVRDIYPGRHPSKPRDTVAFGDKLAFTANDGRHGRELWMSDGTRQGTYMVKDIFAPRRAKARSRLPVARR